MAQFVHAIVNEEIRLHPVKQSEAS
jgi:hypothetical protein